jgi:hypothetical protein
VSPLRRVALDPAAQGIHRDVLADNLPGALSRAVEVIVAVANHLAEQQVGIRFAAKQLANIVVPGFPPVWVSSAKPISAPEASSMSGTGCFYPNARSGLGLKNQRYGSGEFISLKRVLMIEKISPITQFCT